MTPKFQGLNSEDGVLNSEDGVLNSEDGVLNSEDGVLNSEVEGKSDKIPTLTTNFQGLNPNIHNS